MEDGDATKAAGAFVARASRVSAVSNSVFVFSRMQLSKACLICSGVLRTGESGVALSTAASRDEMSGDTWLCATCGAKARRTPIASGINLRQDISCSLAVAVALRSVI